MDEIWNRIGDVSETEMDAVLAAVRRRYRVLFPLYELELLAVRKDQSKRKQIDNTIQLLQRMKED